MLNSQALKITQVNNSLKSKSYSTSDKKKVYFNEEDNQEYKILSYDVRVKSLVQLRISGILSTVTENLKSSVPLYGSKVPFVLDDSRPGVPVIVLEKDDKHMKNLKINDNASLMLNPLLPEGWDLDSLPIPRLNMTVNLDEINGEEWRDKIIQRYAEVHQGSEEYFQYKDNFKFFYATPTGIYYQLSTGTLEYIDLDNYYKVEADPILSNSRKLLEDFNRDTSFSQHVIREFENIESQQAVIYSMDSYGFDLLCNDGKEWMEFRFPLEAQVTDLAKYEEILESIKPKN